MEEHSTHPKSFRARCLSFLWSRDARCVLLLLLLTLGMRVWIIAHTSVAARDSIGFIRYAWRLQHEPWAKVMRDSLHPPLYPLTILAVSLFVRPMMASADPLAMQYSAQIAAALAGILLVLPMFFLGRLLFDRRVGFWSALLFQCLPVASHALSDGLSEAVYLLLAAVFLLCAAYALRRRSLSALALCGICSGLAYLARPEGIVLTFVLFLVLAAAQLWRAQRWPRLAAGCACLLGCTLATAAPYMWVIGGFSNKTSVQWLRGAPGAQDGRVQIADQGTLLAEASDAGRAAADGVRTDAAVLWAAWNPLWTESVHATSHAAAMKMFGAMVVKNFFYFLWLPTLLGMWWFRARIRTQPILVVIGVLCLLHALVLLRLALVAGYVSERHPLLFVLCGAPWMVAGILELPRRLPRLALQGRQLAVVQSLLLIAVACSGMPSTLRSLHPTRVGFRAAGLWIGQNAAPHDQVVDPFCWSEYYAGRVFTEHTHAPSASGQRYVILDNIPSKNHHSHLPKLKEAERLAATGRLVYHWPESHDRHQALVKVYAVPGPAR